MKVLAEITVDTKYQGSNTINQVEVFGEMDEHKRLGWKVQGIHGTYRYLIGYFYDRGEAIHTFAEIQCRLLRAQEEEARKTK